MRKLTALLLALLLLSCGAAQAEGGTGGWALPDDTALTAEIQALFDQALEGLVGVGYDPIAYLGCQIAAGTNHCVLCRATPVYPGAVPGYALVYLNQDPAGNVQITRVAPLPIAPEEGASVPKTIAPLPSGVDPARLAGQTVAAAVDAYDAASSALTLTLFAPETFAAADIAALRPGDVVLSGHQRYPVETIRNDGYYLILNEGDDMYSDGSLWMRQTADGNWRPTAYEDDVWQEIATVSCPVPETMIFLDGIDPAWGDPLDTPTRHSAAEFLRILAEEMENEGVGFFGSNFSVTFGEDGQLRQAERFYVPWQ